MKFIFGYKQEMTQIFKEDGTVVPVTAVKAEPCVITQVKKADKDGYSALQIGFGTRNNPSKPLQGHLKSVMASGRKAFHLLQEVRLTQDSDEYKVGDIIQVGSFESGEQVEVTGTSKGKGFQGVVKRHGFGGSPASHGHKDQLRMPGSIGAQEPQRVFKGTRMGGRTGNKSVTVKNLEIIKVDSENNIVYVKGALPGAKNNPVFIKSQSDLIISGNIFETTAPKSQEAPVEAKEAEKQVETSETKAE